MMSPKRERPPTIEEAARRLADAKMAYDAAVQRETTRDRIAGTEPVSHGRVVKFSHRFDGKVYSYAAIRADNYRGARRWFITSNDGIAQGGHRGITSPATWVELVEFAIPGTVYVAPLTSHWKPVSNLPAVRASSEVDVPQYHGHDDHPSGMDDPDYPHSPESGFDPKHPYGTDFFSY